MQIYSINSGCYPFSIIFFCNCSSEEAKKWLKKEYPTLNSSELCDRGGCCFYVDPPNEYRIYHIWIRNFEALNLEHVGILTHELYHLVRDVCNQLRLEEDPLSTEPGAYLYDHIFKQVIDRVLKRGKRKKK